MFNYATYNGVPLMTYGLVGLTTSILALITFNPSILELKEGDEKSSIGSMMGLDELKMPEMSMPEMSSSIDTSYLPGINMLAQPFSTTGEDSTPPTSPTPITNSPPSEPVPSLSPNDDDVSDDNDVSDDKDKYDVSDNKDDDATGGKKRNKTKNKRKLKRRKTKRRN